MDSLSAPSPVRATFGFQRRRFRQLIILGALFAFWQGVGVDANLESCAEICTTAVDCELECLHIPENPEMPALESTCGSYGVCYEPGWCGDGFCEEQEGETVANCTSDCFIGPGSSPNDTPTCPNAVCETGESNRSCPQDCPLNQIECGDGICEGTESFDNCSADCVYTDFCWDQSMCEHRGAGNFCRARRCVYDGYAETCLVSNMGLDCSSPGAKCVQALNGYGYCVNVF
jgi:hypothetical protein